MNRALLPVLRRSSLARVSLAHTAAIGHLRIVRFTFSVHQLKGDGQLRRHKTANTPRQLSQRTQSLICR